MKVRGSVKPPEWDFISSKVTVYHRANAVEVAREDGQAEWEYDETTYTHAEAPLVMTQLAVAELAETQAADQTANELALAELAEMMGG
jgi:phage terminase Nu1 subunit (DNA packaging protein)